MNKCPYCEYEFHPFTPITDAHMHVISCSKEYLDRMLGKFKTLADHIERRKGPTDRRVFRADRRQKDTQLWIRDRPKGMLGDRYRYRNSGLYSLKNGGTAYNRRHCLMRRLPRLCDRRRS